VRGRLRSEAARGRIARRIRGRVGVRTGANALGLA